MNIEALSAKLSTLADRVARRAGEALARRVDRPEYVGYEPRRRALRASERLRPLVEEVLRRHLEDELSEALKKEAK